jgi:hypothetical protein
VRVLRLDVTVDGQEYEAECGPVLHVDCRRADVVTFWVSDTDAKPRTFRVFGTGVDAGARWGYRGTALSPGSPTNSHAPYGVLVWHLFEREAGDG